jgi:Fe-S oxidoreductase
MLLPLVKEKVFENLGEVPPELQKALENTFRYGNPLGESPKKRQEWVKEAGVPIRILSQDKSPADILWWVECYSSYHPRGIETAIATAKILNAMKLDFAILGNEEVCAGECARLVGETGLFDTMREKNLKTFKKYTFNRIVTSGVHAYDALAFKYPCSGFHYPVEQITPFLAHHIQLLKPLLKKRLDDYVVTYHDSCVLGRHNGFYEEPRTLLSAIPGLKLVEMAHNRENGLCCGGGGGGMWLDTYYKMMGLERLSEKRVKEAVASGADVIAVSCHYEIPRFEDAIKVMGYDQRIIVRDVVELLTESMGG